MRESVRLRLGVLLAVTCLSSTARAQQSASSVEAIHLLESAPYFTCTEGVCESGWREVWSNLTPQESAARGAALRGSVAENVRRRNEGQADIDDATSLALEVADAAILAGDPMRSLDVVVFLEEVGFDFTRLRSLREPRDRSRFDSVVAERVEFPARDRPNA